MSARSDEVCLSHMLEEVQFILQHCRDLSFDAFMADEVLQRAVVRSLEVIGEATKNLSPELRSRHPHLEWQRIAGLRDVLIHKYFGVNWQIVWDVVQHKLPALEGQLHVLIASRNDPFHPG